MIPRGKLDITYTAIGQGILYAFGDIIKKTADALSFVIDGHKLICLSVRTGFDLVLRSLNLTRGSEILVTGISISGMFEIIDEHGLKAVPLSVNKRTLNLSAQQVQDQITPATKAILITHLFGTIADTQEIVAIAKAHQLIIIEDCAQAFMGTHYEGNSLADVVMFSFGMIKTNTTVSGALLKINNTVIFNKVVQLHQQLPVQATGIYLKKMFKVMLIRLLTIQAVYTLFYKLNTGKDFDEVLSKFTKGFPGKNLMLKIRYRPSNANINLVKYRLSTFKDKTITDRIAYAQNILSYIDDSFKIGDLNSSNSYWVLPVQTPWPNELVSYLRVNGFDATKKASSLVRLASAPVDNELLLENIVYLPVHSGMPKADMMRLSILLNTFNKKQ